MKFLAVISSLESELWELDVLGRREENLCGELFFS